MGEGPLNAPLRSRINCCIGGRNNEKTATIGKRVQCIRFVDECASREVSVVSGKKKYGGIDCKASNNFNNERTTVHPALSTH